MYNFCIDGISSAKNKIIATRVSTQTSKEYQFRRLDYSKVYIPNRTAALGLSLQSEESEEKSKLRHNVINFNNYLDYLDGIKGFKSYFAEHNFCVSKEEVENNWSKEIADKVFSLESYVFDTNLVIINDDYLIDTSFPITYSVILDGKELLLPIGKNGWDYPSEIEGKKIIWNFIDNGHDFCCELWALIENYCESKEEKYNEDAIRYGFDYYDQIREEDPKIQLVSIFSKLEKQGFIKTFTIKPEKEDSMWKCFCKSDGSLDCAIVDMSFLKNRLVMEQINLILWSTPEVLKDNPYILTNEKNKQYLSSVPGTICGHKKLKIYGRLDCSSVKKYLAKGQYAKNRVFFLDETTAIKAGYRPCSICMPEEYKKWKQNKKKR